MKEKIGKLDFIKIENLSAKDRRMKAQVGIKYLQSTYLIKDMCPKYTNNSKNSTIKKIPNF